MRSLRDTCIDYFQDNDMPGKIIANAGNEIIIQLRKEDGIPINIDVRVYVRAEDDIEIIISGIGNVKKPKNYYEKINEINCCYRKYKIFIDDDGDILLCMDSNVFSKQFLYRNVMAGIRIAVEVYKEFKKKD